MWVGLYNLFWSVLATFLLPLTSNRERFRKRWALELPHKCLQRGIWVHALSVGETLSAIPLIESLLPLYPKNIAFTVTTKKGMEIALSRLGDKLEIIDFFPFDFFWSVKRFVKQINPSCFILIETDIWPYLLNYLNLKGVKCFLVNGRISPATYKRYSRFPWFIRRIFDCFELCMVQSEQDRKRLMSLGLSGEKVINTGNIKFDRKINPLSNEEKVRLRRLFGMERSDMVWIAGSTHPGEEMIIMEIFKRIRERIPGLVLIIAPRDIKRAPEIYRTGQKMGFEMLLRSKAPASKNPDIIIIDTIGELTRLYGIADIAFVGGSLVPFGGHNLIEPVALGCPVIFGSHAFNFRDISDALIKAGAGIMVKDKEELYGSVLRLIEEPMLRNKIKGSCHTFIQKNRGATERVISIIRSRIDA